MDLKPDKSKSAWWVKYKEMILTFFGLGLIGFEAYNAEVRGGHFHLEFLICGLTLCGIVLAGRLDK